MAISRSSVSLVCLLNSFQLTLQFHEVRQFLAECDLAVAPALGGLKPDCQLLDVAPLDPAVHPVLAESDLLWVLVCYDAFASDE